MSRGTGNQSLQSLLEQLKNANRINLSDMYIGDDGAQLLAQFIRNNKALECLEIRGNNITAQGFEHILAALRLTPMIKILSLEWNALGSEATGYEALAAFLLFNKTVKHIGLSNNKLTGDLLDPIANALVKNTTLLSLDLKWNELGKRGGQLLANMIQENKSLLYLELGGNEIQEQDIEYIEEKLEEHRANNPIEKNRILQIDEALPVAEFPVMSSGLGSTLQMGNTQLVHHLEQMLEQERMHTLHIKQRMERELDELGRRDKSDARVIDDLDSKTKELEADNRNGRFQVEKLREEYKTLERQQEDLMRAMEEKIRTNEFVLGEMEKKHRSNLDRVLSENNFRVRELVRDWEGRCRGVEERGRVLEGENRILEEELRQLGERQIQLKLSYDQELRDLGRRVEEEEYQKFHSVASTLDAKIQAMEEARDMFVKRNSEIAKEYDQREGSGKEELNMLYDELERLRNEGREFGMKNQEFRDACTKLKQDAKIKETAVEKYEKEINTLNEQIALKRKMQEDQLRSIIQEQQADRHIWDQERQKHGQRVKDLEASLRQSHAENARLRSEYQRLAELLQFNVSKVLHQTFNENAYF